MDLLKDTPFETAWRLWQIGADRLNMTVVVKATYTLVPAGPCPVDDEQVLPTGDEYEDDDVECSLHYPSDFAYLKPRGECFVIGDFQAPGGRPVRSSKVAFKIGPVGKQMAIFGDRYWSRGRPSEPAEITSMRLSWEHAYGGAGFEPNPVGRGIHEQDLDGDKYVLLPNIEDPARLIQSPGRRAEPVGSAPISSLWRDRMRFAGTYDAKWQESHYPNLAEDMNWAYCNAAPADQQLQNGYWRGDETLQLRHLHPDHALVECSLPDHRVRAFLKRPGAGLDPLSMRLDTIVVDASAGKVYVVWRGVAEVADQSLDNIDHLFVVHEEAGQRLKPSDFSQWYARKLAEEAADEVDEQPVETPAPESPQEELAAALASVSGQQPGAQWAHLDQSVTVDGLNPDIQSMLRDVLLKKADADHEKGLDSVFDDALSVDLSSGSLDLQETLNAVEADDGLTREQRLDLEVQLAVLASEQKHEQDRKRELYERVQRGESFADQDLTGADLSELTLKNVDFQGAILTSANFSGSWLEGCRFDRAVLTQAELSHAVFAHCSLAECDLTSVRAERTRFDASDLTSVVGSESYFRQSRWNRCKAAGSEFITSDFERAQLTQCLLDGADFSGTVMNQVTFSECNLVDTWMESGVKAVDARFERCVANLLRASEAGDFSGAFFKACQLSGARFGTSVLERAKFQRCMLDRANFSNTTMNESAFVSCSLQKSRFDQARSSRGAFVKCDLLQARFEGADVRETDFRGANLYQAEFLDALYEKARFDLANLNGTRLS